MPDVHLRPVLNQWMEQGWEQCSNPLEQDDPTSPVDYEILNTSVAIVFL